ncbi:MAG TPA: NnrS family protein [candidate division Zixibacteria bacterium]|nr:NnrS family protein [candidate division Zixibacteria bacterium]
MVLFALGFRPFFLLAAALALVVIPYWAAVFAGGLKLEGYYGPIRWHSHEMIFGYGVAVISGFLLTAARNWTGLPTTAGAPLALLSALWLAARVLPFFHGAVSPPLIAASDLVFLPALTVAIAIPLVRSGERRNLIFLPILAAMFLADLMVHAEVAGFARGSARPGIFLGLNLIVLLIVIVGGRVIPFFTERAVAGTAPSRRGAIELLCPASVVAFAAAELLQPGSAITGVLAALAAASNGIRLAGWYTRKIWRLPLLWVLHVGYGWIVTGFCLKMLAAAGAIAPQFAVHAFTVGGIGVLTLGMMARVSLGHTGRPLEPAAPVVLSFVLINAAAFSRGLMPAVFPGWLSALVALSAALWAAAFLLFLVIYAPILTRPRVDGRAG